MVCSNSVSIQAGCYDVQGRPWTLTAVPGCRTVTISWFQQHDVASLRSSDIPTVVVLVQRDVQRQVFQRPMLSLRRSAHLELTSTVTEGSMQEWRTDSSVGRWRVISWFEWDYGALWLCIKCVGLYSYLLTYLSFLRYSTSTNGLP